jgi:hypothetical protein
LETPSMIVSNAFVYVFSFLNTPMKQIHREPRSPPAFTWTCKGWSNIPWKLNSHYELEIASAWAVGILTLEQMIHFLFFHLTNSKQTLEIQPQPQTEPVNIVVLFYRSWEGGSLRILQGTLSYDLIKPKLSTCSNHAKWTRTRRLWE